MIPINGFDRVLNTEDYYCEVAFKLALQLGNLPFLPTELLYVRVRPQKKKEIETSLNQILNQITFDNNINNKFAL